MLRFLTAGESHGKGLIAILEGVPAGLTIDFEAVTAQLMRVEIDRVNGDLARVEQIKSFRILPKALDPEEEGEPVTPTRKVKRKLMYERFRDLVDGMYDDSEERLIAAGAGDLKF